jgi:hypothetical protein
MNVVQERMEAMIKIGQEKMKATVRTGSMSDVGHHKGWPRRWGQQ